MAIMTIECFGISLKNYLTVRFEKFLKSAENDIYELGSGFFRVYMRLKNKWSLSSCFGG